MIKDAWDVYKKTISCSSAMLEANVKGGSFIFITTGLVSVTGIGRLDQSYRVSLQARFGNRSFIDSMKIETLVYDIEFTELSIN